MGVDECQKIIGAGKCPEDASIAQVSNDVLCPDPLPSIWKCLAISLSVALSKAQSRAKEELEALLKRRYIEGPIESGASFISPKGEGDGCHKDATPELIHCLTRKERLKDDIIRLLSYLAVVRAKRDEAVNSAEATREEASGLFAELVIARPEAEALRVRDVDSYVNEGQVALLGSREVEPFSEFEMTWAEGLSLSIPNPWSSWSIFAVTFTGYEKSISALITPEVGM
ncbi:hypothetical protein ACLOJK_028947 [Asimina triloba]